MRLVLEAVLVLALYVARGDSQRPSPPPHTPPPNRPDPNNFAGQFSKPSLCSIELAKNAKYVLEATKAHVQSQQLNPTQVINLLSSNPPSLEDIGEQCPPKPQACERLSTCQRQKFRTIDGYCNNLREPFWGNAHTPFKRYLPPSYSNGYSAPRVTSVTGEQLPSPRRVTTRVHSVAPSFVPTVSMWLMQWGQFLDHDITLTPTVSDDDITTCCVDDPADLHDECFPIAVSTRDLFYSQFNVTCLDFRRSEPTVSQDCHIGFRQQINQITSFIDGSNVYGSTRGDEQDLREFRDGLLRSQPNPDNPAHKEYLPDDPQGGCLTREGENAPCFKAGDIRVSEQPGLTTAHTIWLREHNRIARKLKEINPVWSDNTIFQESRRIVGALLQHITYTEFLPVVLGNDIMVEYELTPQLSNDGFSYKYDERINPSIANVFAAAAYRFGHSLVHDTLSRVRRVNQVEENDELRVSEGMFRPYTFNESYPGGVDPLVRGLGSRPVWKVDFKITRELRDHLFPGHGQAFGSDLAAKNIQRGRDHGLPGYNEWRQWCGLQPRTFQELINILPDERGQRFQEIYDNVDDIDLFSIGICEPPLPGALVGETFAHILAQQFHDIKFGDRFWYENGGFFHSFTMGQLTEIRKVSFSRVLCHNTDEVTNIHARVMLTPNPQGNPHVPCSQLPEMDLNEWKI